MKRLPPTKPCGGCLRGQGKLIVDKAENRRRDRLLTFLFQNTQPHLKLFSHTDAKNEIFCTGEDEKYYIYNVQLSSSSGFSPRLGEVSEIHLSDEAPADASIITVLQQHSFLPAICLVTLCPVSTHSQVELHKLRPFCVQVPAHQLP